MSEAVQTRRALVSRRFRRIDRRGDVRCDGGFVWFRVFNRFVARPWPPCLRHGRQELSHGPAGLADTTAQAEARHDRADHPQPRDDATARQQSTRQRCASEGHGTDSTTGGIQRMNDRGEPSLDDPPANRIDRADSPAESKMIEVLWTARRRQKSPIGSDVVWEKCGWSRRFAAPSHAPLRASRRRVRGVFGTLRQENHCSRDGAF